MTTYDLGPSAASLTTVVQGIRDDQLGGPTPCPAYTVGDLAEHADAWAQASAREGTTWAGPVEMSAEEVGLVVLDELVVHGWDLAVSTGQAYAADPVAVAACTGWVSRFAAPDAAPDDGPDDGGLCGPPLAVVEGASALDRLLGMTGRDRSWRPEPRQPWTTRTATRASGSVGRGSP